MNLWKYGMEGHVNSDKKELDAEGASGWKRIFAWIGKVDKKNENLV